jgi:hypothetical protein
MIYDPVNGIAVWRTGQSNELYRVYDELHTLKVIIIGRLMWQEHLFRIQEMDLCRRLVVLNPEAVGV